ncbi:unnamed protein product [Pseudo-nitzschia multistriata]|uniref:Small-subunit processome Utp12 domain-containing protein n=1 Tax=Pseudo-nitzschia multistriata TaxID=183589 RepID=A0A448ZB34_9STRA|nr:unnamed protein product [Pseudo-nitzschia multistriata]
MNLLLSASSPDGSLAAIKAPSSASSSRHLIRIYQVGDSSTTLQSTLTHASNLPLVQLIFAGRTSVLGLFGRQEVVVWDLDRGVVAATFSASDDQAFLSLAAPSDDEEENENNYYALVRHGPKLVVHEYLASSNKLRRKIKSGRMNDSEDGDVDYSEMEKKDAASLIITSSHVIVRAKGCGIRVMEKDSGKKTGKIKLKESSYGEASSMEMSSCIGDQNILAAIEKSGDAVLFDLGSCKEVARLPTDSSPTQKTGLQLVAQQTKEDSFTLFRYDSLYSIVTEKNRSSPYEKISQLSSSNPVAVFLRSNDKALALIQQRSSDYRVQVIDFSEDSEEELPAVFKLDQEASSKGKNEATSKKKRNSSEIKVLGPGQAGSETITSVKKLRVNSCEDEDEMDVEENGDDDDGDETRNLTIGERLQMLTDALDEENNDGEENDNDDDKAVTAAIAAAVGKTKFKPQKATTESLKELLTQALQSSDDNLLELALSVHDMKIIATTIKEMNEDLLVILLGKLTSRLASSPLRAESLSIWISHCLKRGSFDSEHLAVLRNMLYERIESFSDLLRLEGRLSMMVD